VVLNASGSRMNGLQTRTTAPFNLQTFCNIFTRKGRTDMGDGEEDGEEDGEDDEQKNPVSKLKSDCQIVFMLTICLLSLCSPTHL